MKRAEILEKSAARGLSSYRAGGVVRNCWGNVRLLWKRWWKKRFPRTPLSALSSRASSTSSRAYCLSIPVILSLFIAYAALGTSFFVAYQDFSSRRMSLRLSLHRKHPSDAFLRAEHWFPECFVVHIFLNFDCHSSNHAVRQISFPLVRFCEDLR